VTKILKFVQCNFWSREDILWWRRLKKTLSLKAITIPIIIKGSTTYLHAAISRLTRMDAPVVAAVHGAVAGAGMSIAIACDIGGCG